MKRRYGFVSNSSSTSFTFVFKGDKVEDLSNTIMKYKSFFDLSFFDEGWGDNDNTTYTCNAQEVGEAIEKYVKSEPKYEFDKVSVVSIDNHIANLVKEINSNYKYIGEEKEKQKNDPSAWSCIDLWEEHNIDLKNEVNSMRSAKDKGLHSVLVIGFGDNDGQISGGSLGHCMDYEGRYMSIDEDDFMVYTEQNR